MYPFRPEGEDQSDIGAGSASGQPFLKRSTRSGLLMKGRPKEINLEHLLTENALLIFPVNGVACERTDQNDGERHLIGSSATRRTLSSRRGAKASCK